MNKPVLDNAAGNQGANGEPAQKSDWTSILTSIIPGEVTAVYLGIRSVVAMIGQTEEAIGAYVPFVLLSSIFFLVVATPYFMSRIRGTEPKAGLFVAVSFLIWALNIDYDRMLELVFLVDQGLLYAIVSYAIPVLLITWAGLFVPIFVNELKKPEAEQARKTSHANG